MGFVVDIDSLLVSHRCSPSVCKFILDRFGIQMHSARNDDTKIFFVENETLGRRNISKWKYSKVVLSRKL